MKKNEKNTSSNNNTKNNSVELSKVTFVQAKEYKDNQNLTFSATIKNLCAPYAPANKPFPADILKQYSIENDSSLNCFRAILLDETGQYKIYRAIDKYTTNKTSSEKLLKAFNTFIGQHDFSETGLCEHVQAIHAFLSDRVASEAAARELAKRERERAKEAAKVEKTIKSLQNVDTATLEALQEFIKTRLAQ